MTVRIVTLSLGLHCPCELLLAASGTERGRWLEAERLRDVWGAFAGPLGRISSLRAGEFYSDLAHIFLNSSVSPKPKNGSFPRSTISALRPGTRSERTSIAKSSASKSPE